ncbi:MAG TPA: NAD(P)-dependent oxidoreductase [Kofleriaceae bacterium]|nr:NAD(P)-dependent oxidoreductase [Kofleriaceae bacterium]
MTEVAFIGLGAMGSRMAMNLHNAGFALRVWNRDPAKARPVADAGARPAASPADAASGAAFVVSIVADDLATREVMLGASGILAHAAPGTIVIDASTNTPAMAREVAAAAAARGVHYLDAPVLGSTPQAEAGELVFLVGGDRAVFDRSKPVLAAMSRTCHYLGDSGAGATVKLLNNMVSGALLAVLAEAAQMAEAARLDPAATIAALSDGAAGSRMLRSKLPKMFERDFTPQFQLELMEKDLRYFLQLAADLDRPAPLASLVRSQYQAARRAELGKLDSCAIFLEISGER